MLSVNGEESIKRRHIFFKIGQDEDDSDLINEVAWFVLVFGGRTKHEK